MFWHAEINNNSMETLTIQGRTSGNQWETNGKHENKYKPVETNANSMETNEDPI